MLKSAKKFERGLEACCIKDISVADVPVGRVSILALSVECNVLAACVGRHIHLFSISRLLDEGVGASFIRPLTYSSCIKDMEFRPECTSTAEYVVLTTDGQLYHGAVWGKDNFYSFQHNVDCVCWSVHGKYLAVARDGLIIILSSEKEEKFRIKLLFDTLADKKDDSVIKVDSIRWVRPDCIILGCYSLCPDGNEKNHMIQLISVKKGKITNTCANPVALNFPNVFLALNKDIPSGSGPYTIFSYLHNLELAFVANRRSTDQQIVLFGWSSNKEKGAEVLNIAIDDWLPTINLKVLKII